MLAEVIILIIILFFILIRSFPRQHQSKNRTAPATPEQEAPGPDAGASPAGRGKFSAFGLPDISGPGLGGGDELTNENPNSLPNPWAPKSGIINSFLLSFGAIQNLLIGVIEFSGIEKLRPVARNFANRLGFGSIQPPAPDEFCKFVASMESCEDSEDLENSDQLNYHAFQNSFADARLCICCALVVFTIAVLYTAGQNFPQ